MWAPLKTPSLPSLKGNKTRNCLAGGQAEGVFETLKASPLPAQWPMLCPCFAHAVPTSPCMCCSHTPSFTVCEQFSGVRPEQPTSLPTPQKPHCPPD